MSTKRRTDSLADADELALLSAFLDGELSSSEEAALLHKLSQNPLLQDALDELADQIVSTQRLLAPSPAGSWPSYRSTADDDADPSLDIAARVMAEIDAAAMADSASSVEHLSSLALDGAATPAQSRRLDQLLETHADTAFAFAAAVDVTRAAVHVDGVPEVARSLETLPDHVLAKVERTERAWALSAGAVDGQLSAAEENELAGLCGADGALLVELETQQQHTHHVAEALRAAADSPAFLRYAERAGAAALQAIAATQLQQAPKPQTTTTTAPLSLLARIKATLGQGFAPLMAASVAALAFVVIGKSEPATTSNPEPGAFAELQKQFLDVVAPVVLAENRSVPTAELAVLRDNTADVMALDATSTTMVFSTAESNITVIWVAGFDDDAEEQGT
ncbi:MAG: hypothetical protein Q8O67_24880 [Deltaproteobacteria bacterium]|nr:hypothetical protein [Deltaproteobacteria bacterium]